MTAQEDAAVDVLGLGGAFRMLPAIMRIWTKRKEYLL